MAQRSTQRDRTAAAGACWGQGSEAGGTGAGAPSRMTQSDGVFAGNAQGAILQKSCQRRGRGEGRRL